MSTPDLKKYIDMLLEIGIIIPEIAYVLTQKTFRGTLTVSLHILGGGIQGAEFNVKSKK
jgi:hypothetical protein